MEVNAIIFGATGHIGQGVLIECLEHPRVRSVLVIGRKSCGREHKKLREIIHADYLDYSAIEKDLAGYRHQPKRNAKGRTSARCKGT